MDSWFHLQESLQDRFAVLESELGPEAHSVPPQHLEVLDALAVEQRPWRRVATTLTRLRARFEGAAATPAMLAVATDAPAAGQRDENAA